MVGRLLKRPLRVTLFRSGLPKVAFLHLRREGWENTEGVRTEGGLLLLLECNLSHEYFGLFIRSMEVKNALILPSSLLRFISWMTFEFNKTVSCNADIFYYLKVVSAQPKEPYSLIEDDAPLPSSKEVSILL